MEPQAATEKVLKPADASNVVPLRPVPPPSNGPEFTAWREARASWDTLTILQRWESSTAFMRWLAAEHEAGRPIEQYRPEARDAYELSGELLRWANLTLAESRRAEQATAIGKLVGYGLLAGIELLAQRTADAISAKATAPAASLRRDALTPELVDAWLASIDGSTEAGTRKEYRRVALAQWVPFFGTVDAIGPRVKAYTNDRLKRVSKTMHKKELSALRGFLAWAEEQGHIAEAPHVPAPPRKATGKRSATHKAAPVSVSEAEIERIIGLLPEWARARRGAERHRVRDVFVLAWETGLRPITIGRLRVPEHWRPGMRSLNITADIDKARFGRELPLTPRAVDVLERCAPASGLVFGPHDYRAPLKKAASEAGLDPERAKHFSKYDFRHNRADFLLDQGADLRAVAYNHGHKLLTTTDKYLRPSKKGAEAMLAKVAGRSGASSGSGACSCTADGVLDEAQASEYPSLPTRTWRNWQTHQIQVLAG